MIARMKCLSVISGLTVLLAAGWPTARPGDCEEVLPPDEDVTRIVVKIQLGATGEAIEEPISLDLGFGFPLWLEPLGRKPGISRSFGAIPQHSTAEERLEPGRNAPFTFSREGEPGQDFLRTTPQLLAGVRVLDIGRIGFTGTGKTDGVLEGYEIQVNGRVLASATGLNQRIRAVQESDRTELADLGLKITPLEAEKADLNAFVQAKLATPTDEKRLKEILALLEPLQARKAHLEGRLAGIEPWYEHSDFQPAVNRTAAITSLQVTVITANHSGADTKNFAYFCAGGHKYALNPDGSPLTSAAFSQDFTLNLRSGPLAAADLRGWALGTLAQNQAGDAAPDRWHPQRLVVRVDGRVLYDSEENETDRASLAAIRLVPPAHLDGNSKVIVNSLAAREVYHWEPGKGMGLDRVTGQPFPLPDSKAPDYPKPESTPGKVGSGGAGFAETPGPSGDQLPKEMAGPGDDLFDGCEPLFPGEEPPTWDKPWFGQGGWPPGVTPGFQPPWPDNSNGGWGGSADIGPWIVAWLWQWLFESAHGTNSSPLPPIVGPGGWTTLPGQLPPGNDPAPIGQPFQIKEDSVAIVAGWTLNDEFTVRWDIIGDESQIQGYDVSLVELYPERDVPFGATVLSVTVPAARNSSCREFRMPPGVSSPVLSSETVITRR